jgi:hypothetical protein
MARLKKLALSAVGLAVVVRCVSAQLTEPTTGHSRPTLKQIERDPLTISASESGMFQKGYSWELHVDTTGKARLTIWSSPDPKKREFQLSQNQIDELRRSLAKEHFFELSNEYGGLVSDGSTTTVIIAVGTSTKSVVLRYFWIENGAEKLREPARAIRVLNVIRGWFNDPEAVDLRKYSRLVLDAVARDEKAK